MRGVAFAGLGSIALASLLLIPACGGRATIPLEKFQNRLVASTCQVSVQCGEYPDDATCLEATNSGLAQLMADVESGKTKYDDAAAADCLSAVAASGCNQSDGAGGPLGPCGNVFKGTVPVAGACFADTECVSQNCNTAACAGIACCPGVCEPLVEVGGDCSAPGARCVPTAVCRRADGAASSTCQPRVALGHSCERADDCSAGLWCIVVTSGAPGTCVTFPDRGEACVADTLPCNSSLDVCDARTGTCVARTAVGGACGNGGGCVAFASCAPDTMTCVARGAVGAPCTQDDACLDALVCEDGTCARPPSGAACTSPVPDRGAADGATSDAASDASDADGGSDVGSSDDAAADAPGEAPNGDGGSDADASDAPSAPAGPVVQIATGGAHACALRAGGSMWCWGSGFFGQLGDATNSSDRPEPAPILPLGDTILRVSAGQYNSAAITADHSLWLWGRNDSYQLGDGTKTQRAVPWRSPTLAGVTASISQGYDTTCALKTDGTVWCWGTNRYGRLGDGTMTDRPTPVMVTGLGPGVVQVSVSNNGDDACARMSDGTVWCWGTPPPRTYLNPTTMPEKVVNVYNAAQVSVGGLTICVRATGGWLWCWGANSSGEVGDGTTMDRSQPTIITSLGSDVADVSVGTGHTCVRKTDGTVWCWGNGIGGAVPGGLSATPVQVTDLGNKVVELAAGDYRTCARKGDNSVWCWGMFADGIIVQGQMSSVPKPVQITFPP